nr:hypothetical protein [Candidatus Sigynarchaeota archaeon]
MSNCPARKTRPGVASGKLKSACLFSACGGREGDTRLAFEQVQRGLGVADGKVNRLRAELDKLVSRGIIKYQEGWIVLRGKGSQCPIKYNCSPGYAVSNC